MAVKPITNSSKYMAKDFFVYEMNFSGALAAAGSTPLTVTIDNDADFEWMKASYHGTVGNDGTTRTAEQIPEVNVTIRDTTSGRDLMNLPVAARNIFGSGEIPFILPVTKIFPARSTIQMTVVNASDNLTYSTLLFSFIGAKLFFK